MCAFSLIGLNGISQEKKQKNYVGIEMPIIWNHSEAKYYQLGSPVHKTGKSLSYGINVNYSTILYKQIFGKIGVGYFKQNFNIERPFDFDDPTSLSFYTKSYSYENIYLLLGIGYKQILTNKINLNGLFEFIQLISYKQKYTPAKTSNSSFQNSQKNSKTITLGKIFNAAIGLERIINQQFSVEFEVLLPLKTEWNNDPIFYKYDYSNDAQKIAKNKFSIGSSISCLFHF